MPWPFVDPKEPKQERLCELLNYLSDRLHLGDRTAEAALLDYLNRFDEVTSASSLRRWFRGQQFPWPSRRPLLAQAIGVEPTELEQFLLQGIPQTQEFLESLPPIDPEFRASNEWDTSIKLDSQTEVSSAMLKLSQHLSLENLVDLIDELRAQARNRVEQLQAQTLGPSARTTILGQQDWSTISQVLGDKNLAEISQLVDLPLPRLEAIAHGDEPACTEVTLLAAALGIQVQQLETMREREFGSKSNHSDCPENCHT
ncbi:hypothetical protein [Laspinema olomoucense]|uniref:hypothetical protein n=1 Tax=Laspinema olomoucense TaxID=3231600 RepID=UPI0021BB0630|nr:MULTISPECIES: hypothetical protein [unclassified Laspinema]MCT7997444.1 hypothetical protein [Laspinema sp. D3c]